MCVRSPFTKPDSSVCFDRKVGGAHVSTCKSVVFTNFVLFLSLQFAIRLQNVSSEESSAAPSAGKRAKRGAVEICEQEISKMRRRKMPKMVASAKRHPVSY
ncbi:uncharacterized protein LOC131214105 [Anopheles bellator]|uniref:uncharacterized protein LOC131214105 n=1 Tax=Anopheles bellator TaxID=139047 RepID=UPI0026495C48|nr:uncharacterized protein LOC131214105 [Anopheles bellator]